VTHQYALHGISASGIVIGPNMIAPWIVTNPHFFGPEEIFVNSLKGMLWGTTEVGNFVSATVMQVYCVTFKPKFININLEYYIGHSMQID